jgi:glycosyltransferase involved in cell wall biosynthesis
MPETPPRVVDAEEAVRPMPELAPHGKVVFPGDHDSGGGRNRLKVVYLTQWFPPEPVETPLWIAESLRRQGLDVRVLTGIPNFPTGQVQEGFSAWRGGSETRAGFNVRRVPLYPSHDRSTVGRIANYASYAVTSATAGAAFLRSAGAALVYFSPATAATAAMTSRVPYVLLVQDVWPDSVFATGFLSAGLVRRLAETSLTWFTKQAYRRAHHIAVTSPGMRDLLVDRGVPPGKLSIIYNWVDETVMHPSGPDPELRKRLAIGDGFLLMFAGNHGAAQALHVPIRAMAELRDLPDLHLVLVGEGIEKSALQLLVQELRLRSVHFIDRIDPRRIATVMAAADLQLVSLADERLFHITLPSKVQTILACGQPVLSCAPGDASRVVRDAGAGFVCAPGNHEALAATIRQAYHTPRARLKDMGLAGHAYYSATMSEAINARRLADLLIDAAKANRGRSRG